MTKRDQLITEIEVFCAQWRLSERRFGLLATGNVKFMGRLRRGVVTSRSMDKADMFMTSYHGEVGETSQQPGLTPPGRAAA